MATLDKMAMREYVSDAYDSINWRRRVSEMTDYQVFAVYRSLIEREERRQVKKKEEEKYRQMTIFDYI